MAKGGPGKPENLTNAGKGRPKGCQNKFTSLKDSFLQAFEGMGGTQELMEWAKKPQNRPQFYQMIAKMLPSKAEITGEDGGPIEITDRTPIESARRIAFALSIALQKKNSEVAEAKQVEAAE